MIDWIILVPANWNNQRAAIIAQIRVIVLQRKLVLKFYLQYLGEKKPLSVAASLGSFSALLSSLSTYAHCRVRELLDIPPAQMLVPPYLGILHTPPPACQRSISVSQPDCVFYGVEDLPFTEGMAIFIITPSGSWRRRENYTDTIQNRGQ